MLLKLAFKNVKNNYKSYVTYFLSVTFAVMMVYLFLAIFYNPLVNDSLGSDKKFMLIFNVSSVVTVFFSAFFIWYSNSFFIKVRKKEFATYMLLGMSRFEVFILIFFENIIIMLISFSFGIFVGVLLSKFFIMVLMALIKSNIKVAFTFEFKAFLFSSKAFAVIFVLISIHSAALVYKYRLIDLFNANKKKEEAPKPSIFTATLGIAALVAIIYGYYIALTKGSKATDIYVYGQFMTLILVGTIFLFYCTVIFFIQIMRKNKSSYYKGTNLVYISQLLYRYKGNAGSLAVISVLSAVAITSMCFCYSFYTRVKESTQENRPLSIQYIASNNKLNNEVDNIINSHKEVSVKSKDDLKLIKGNLNYRGMQNPCYIISESQYNSIVQDENYGNKINLKSTGESYNIDVEYSSMQSSIFKNSKEDISINNYSKTFTMEGSTTKRYIAIDDFQWTFVLSDSDYNEYLKHANIDEIVNIRGYMLSNDLKAGTLISQLNKVIPKDNQFYSYYMQYQDVFKAVGVFMFIGAFMGILFILATGSIIYFKQIVEASEDKYRYLILSKIGLDDKEIKHAVMKQLALIFGMPLLVSIGHSYVASALFGQMFHADLNFQYAIVLLFYTALYVAYYFLTVRSYTKLVTENN